jgi:hypothetical protein
MVSGLIDSERMHARKLCLSFVLVMQMFFLQPPAFGMDLPHYDVDSLVYVSTDVVIAHLSVNPSHEFTATVTETIYGSLHPGDKLDTLSEFLSFFRPIEDGQDVVLFLDGRPRKPDFFHPEASNSPFAVARSGVYLIDAYRHVHEYFQEINPGPYVAQGYSFLFEKTVPTEKQDLALPTIEEIKTRISISQRAFAPARSLLDKAATPADAPSLLALLHARLKDSPGCGLNYYDPIAQRISSQIYSLNDPELLLRLHLDFGSDIEFVQPPSGQRDPTFTASRVKYLLTTLSDASKDLPLRTAAIEILIGISKFHTGAHSGPSKPLPIDNQWLAASAAEIVAAAKSVFESKSQNGTLRALCLQFLDLGQPEILADVKRVYVGTRSDELRYAIEVACLDVSDALYQSLSPTGRPVASIVSAAPDGVCARVAAGSVVFLAKYYERQDHHDRGEAAGQRRFFLTNLQTRQRFSLGFADIHLLAGWGGVRDGQTWFALGSLSDFPVGKYTLGLEYERDGKILSAGYTSKINITNASTGKIVSVN